MKCHHFLQQNRTVIFRETTESLYMKLNPHVKLKIQLNNNIS